MYQVSLKSEGGRPFFVITWPGITQLRHAVTLWSHDMGRYLLYNLGSAVLYSIV